MKFDIKMLAIILIVIMIVALVLCLGGCTTTKTIEVPVPIPCTKPKNIPVPHDYMADLNKQSQPADFIKACLATRESCFNAYNACAIYHGE
jgi:hypothetical protein